MSRDESLQLKGIAILLMLALHLFSDLGTVTAECDWLIPFWNGKPIVYAFSRVAACCVPIYLFLGGYGLSRTFEQSPQMHNGRRVLSLYANFWIVFLLFMPLACVIRPEDYPQDLPTLALSTIAWTSTYNGAWWFLLPYAVFTLSEYPDVHFHAGSRFNELVEAWNMELEDGYEALTTGNCDKLNAEISEIGGLRAKFTKQANKSDTSKSDYWNVELL